MADLDDRLAPVSNVSDRLSRVILRSAPQVSDHMTLVQALRGIAAIWVVLFHAAEGHHIDALLTAMPTPMRIAIFGWGHYGVAIFFALSGFVIAHSLRGAQVNGRFFGRFVLRRLIRLDPPYWGAILICIGFGWLSARAKHEIAVFPGLSTVGAHIVYLQELLRKPEINGAFWTLTYEVQFYLILCFCLFIVHAAERLGWSIVKSLVVPAAFGIAIWSATGLMQIVPNGLFVRLWYAFFLGVMAYWSMSRPSYRLAFAALLVMMIIPFWRADFGFGITSGCTALLLFLAGMTGWLYRGLRWRWLQFCGLISYSLYLLHNPVTGATGFIAREVFGNGLIANTASLLLIAVTTVLTAALYFYLVERPAQRISRKTTAGRKMSWRPQGNS